MAYSKQAGMEARGETFPPQRHEQSFIASH